MVPLASSYFLVESFYVVSLSAEYILIASMMLGLRAGTLLLIHNREVLL